MKIPFNNSFPDMRLHIFSWAGAVAVVLNLDKILLGPWSLLRIHDVFDIVFPAAQIVANNILKYGFVSQMPEQLCGVSSLTFPIPPIYIALMTVLQIYPSYLVLCLLGVFVAFAGMFLLLHDEFKLNQTASLAGALFFSAIAMHMAVGISGVGIPLFLWCFERIFDAASSFKKRLASYLYILLYFTSVNLPIFVLPLSFFFMVYFCFFSRIRKTPRNLITVLLIWGLLGLINLPAVAEFIANVPNSHRLSMTAVINQERSWGYAAWWLLNRFFNISMHHEYISTPSLLGIFIVLFYFASSKKEDRNTFFYLPIILLLVIEVFSFYLYNSPVWTALMPFLGALKSFQFDRLFFVLVILFAFLIGQASHYLITHDSFSCRRSWHLTIGIFSAYLALFFLFNALGLGYGQFPLGQLSLQLLSLAVLISLLWFKYFKGAKYSTGSILVIAFLFFSFANTLSARFEWGFLNYHNMDKPPQIELIKQREGNNLQRFRVATIKGWRQPPLMINGFKCADGYANIYPQSYKEFWTQVIAPEIKKSTACKTEFLNFGGRVFLFDDSPKNQPLTELSFKPDLLQLINVKYLFSEERILDCGKYGLIEVAQKSEASVNAPKWQRYFQPWEYYVYQNKDYAAPAFLTGAIHFYDEKAGLLDGLGRHNYEYLATHTLAVRGEAPLENAGLNAAEAKILEMQLTPDEMTVRLENRYPVILNWTTNYNRNWVCEVDGRPAPVIRIYNTFMGVLVPPESHLVKFRYHNILLSRAGWLAIIGFVLINTYVIISFRRPGSEGLKNHATSR